MTLTSRAIAGLTGCLIAAFGLPALPARAEEMRSQTISVEQGLSQSSIWSMFLDREGYLWFGTADGLNRYDGYSFLVFRHDPHDSLSICDNTVYAIVEDRSGDLWVATAAGLDRYDRTTGRFAPRNRASGSPMGRGAQPVRSLLAGRSGTLWAGTPSGCYALDPSADAPRRLPSPPLAADAAFLMEEADGTIWVGMAGALVIYDPRSGRVTDPGIPMQPGRTMFTSVYRDREGTWWVGTNGGLYSSEGGHPPWRSYRHDPDDPRSLSENTIRDISEDRNGNLWVATYYGGVNWFDRKSHAFSRFVPRDAGGSSKRFEGAVNLLCDRSGLIWVGYDGAGVVKIDPNRMKFPHILLPPSGGKSTGDNFFKSIMVGRTGSIWLGTFDQGVVLYDRRTGLVRRFPHEGGDPHSVRDNRICALLEDSRGRVWVGTALGLDEYEKGSGRFRHYSTPQGWEKVPGDNWISSLCEDSVGRLWVGSLGGLLEVDDSAEGLRAAPMGLADSPLRDSIRIESLAADRGGLWIGTRFTGLIRWESGSGEARFHRHDAARPSSISSDLVKTICVDGDSVIWCGTPLGLNRFDLRRGRWKQYYASDGLPNDFIYGILMDRNRNLWISTNKGLSRLNARDPGVPSFRNYTPDDGLQSYEFNTGVYCYGQGGELLFGGVNGFNVFDPDSVRDNPVVPPVVLTGFKKFDQAARWEEALNGEGEISLRHSESVFSLEFAALEFTNPSQNQYSYKLEGFDQEWVRCGNRREARYTNLDPGKYLFRVRGSNNDGVWNEEGASLGITILPPFWRSWWAYAFYAAAAASAGAGVRWLAGNWNTILANRRSRFISHYRLYDLLGEGGMGRVYRAVDLRTRETVALKVLSAELLNDPENRRRLAAEGQLLSSFSHPHIVRVFEAGEAGERGFIAMEYLTGGTLKQLLASSFPLPAAEASRLFLQMCDGLAAIHSRGVIHRDLKTGNIMLDGSGNVRIMDFGLSKSPLVTTMTTLGTVIGTLGYVAPEQVTGIGVDHRADLFAAGVVLYELLTGVLPFRGENEIAVIHSIFNTEPPPPSVLRPGLSPEYDPVVARCLAKNPAERYQGVEELRSALSEVPVS